MRGFIPNMVVSGGWHDRNAPLWSKGGGVLS